MNYIWNIPIESKRQQIELKDIKFKLSEEISPYLEVNNDFLNQKELKYEIEINPYYRFFSIFKSLFEVDYYKYQELRKVFFDILIHFLAYIDVKQGMDQDEFFKKFIHIDIKNGLLGKKVKEGFEYLTIDEKNILLNNIYKNYSLGEHLFFFKKTIKRFFKRVIIYIKQRLGNKIIVFINEYETEENKVKLGVLEELFCPITFELEVYWKGHFGVIGANKTMKIGEAVIY